MKIGTALLILLVGAICGALATHFYKERKQPTPPEVVDMQAQLDSLHKIISRDSLELIALNKRIEQQRDSLNKLIDESEAARVVLAGEVKVLSDSIEGQLPDHLRPAFFRLKVAYQEQIELLEGEKIALSSVIVSQDTLIQTYTSLNADLHEALARSEELKEYWKDQAKRDWWEKPQFTAPLAVGATLVAVSAVKTVVD